MAAVSVWLGGAVAYMVLAGQVSADEVVAAAILGAFGAGWHAAVLRDGAERFRFERTALGAIGSALARCPGATLRVGGVLAAALVRPAEGRLVEQPFERGKVDDPRDRGRRAVVVLATSLAPDSYALRLSPGEGAIVFHALTAASPSRDTRWPS